jgi:hypothetical protein
MPSPPRALIISRVAHPGSKLSTLAWQADTTLGPDLGIDDATTDDVYAAMDWLQARQDTIESRLARRHLAPQANPQRIALFDLSSSWLEGTHCPLGERGYSRDGKKGKVQIEYGLLTDPEGRAVGGDTRNGQRQHGRGQVRAECPAGMGAGRHAYSPLFTG